MPFTRYDKTGLTSMSDAARMVGQSVGWFWIQVRELGKIEAPSVEVGKRSFYSKEQIDRILRQVAELRTKGVK